MEAELREIFTHCEGFDGVNDEVSFAKYIARCQIETTMPFNDYYVDLDATVKSLPVWPVDKNLIPAGAGAVVIVLGLIIFCFMSGMSGLIVMLLGAAVLAGGLWMAYASILAAGAKPFPAAPNSKSSDRSQGPPSAADIHPLRDRQADAGSRPSVGAEIPRRLRGLRRRKSTR